MASGTSFIGMAISKVRSFVSRELLEIWLYGKNFHQDTGRKAMYAELQKFGAFTFALQDIVMVIAIDILNLAQVVRFALSAGSQSA